MIAPSVAQMAEEYATTLTVAKVDVDENPAVPGRYGIFGIPTLMLFKDGQVVERITGALPKDQIVARVLPHLEVTAA
jgi:thioredoxin 1